MEFTNRLQKPEILSGAYLSLLDGTCEVPDVGTCIFEAKTASAYKAGEGNGKIKLKPVSGDQTACGEWVELSDDRVYGYCTLLERHLNRKEGH